MDIPEGILIGFGNPFLDMLTTIEDNSILEKYDLQANAAIIAEEKHLALYEEMSYMENVIYSAGGACQNSMRIFQWIIEKPYCAYFVGAVGLDKFGEIIEKRAKADGVQTVYQYTDEAQTGTCAVLVSGRNRSLIANLGAASLFSEDWLDDEANMCIVERAKFIYTTGFFLAVSARTVSCVAEMSSKSNQICVLNFSAVFVVQTQKRELDGIIPFIDMIISSKQEALAFADTHDWNTSDIFEIGKRLQALPKDNIRPRIVLIVDNVCAVLCFQENDRILEYPAPKVDNSVNVDSNGQADAFVGGFLSQMVQNMPMDYCIRAGIFASQQVGRIMGCQIDKLPKFKECCI